MSAAKHQVITIVTAIGHLEEAVVLGIDRTHRHRCMAITAIVNDDKYTTITCNFSDQVLRLELNYFQWGGGSVEQILANPHPNSRAGTLHFRHFLVFSGFFGKISGNFRNFQGHFEFYHE